MVNSLLNIYRHDGYMPDARSGNWNGRTQGGSNADIVIADAFAHKGTFGHGLLVAGNYGMAGAAVLAARACLRSGIGKVTIHTPQRNNDILQLAVPEAILTNSAGDEHISQSISSEPFQAVAIGPGIGTEQTTAVAFIEQVRHTRVPLVIDADGLNILAEHKGWMQQMPAGCILTPHPLEMRRLGIRSTDSYSTLLESLEIAARYMRPGITNAPLHSSQHLSSSLNSGISIFPS